jgi:hypothetical protein
MLALGLTLLCTGCMVVPRTTESCDPDCQLTHRQIVLDVEQVQVFPGPCSDNRACVGVLFILGAVGAGSATVSGSIAVVGNVAHWLERKANCEATQDPTQPVKRVREPGSAALHRNERSSMPQLTTEAAGLSEDEVLAPDLPVNAGPSVKPTVAPPTTPKRWLGISPEVLLDDLPCFPCTQSPLAA